MKVKTIIDEDFLNYRKPSMFIGTMSCAGKCCLEAGIPISVCQNDGWRNRAPVEINDRDLCERYLSNDLTHAFVFGGLEPLEQIQEIEVFIRTLRQQYKSADDIVIYTGYYPDEIKRELNNLRQFPNIIVKFGRYIPDKPHRYDEVHGVELSSDNQYAERLS